TTLRWLENQLLDGATSVTLRIQASIEQGEALFAWDSGVGAETEGDRPLLLLNLGPPPPTPPPLPTKPVVVATLTPVPQDVLTVVAMANTATAVAFTTGTYTPVPYAIVTPTPFPANLETVQAMALAQQLPAVALHTPTPASPLLATRQAEYATAVALTTGTFTPVPTDFVTPMLVVPSPPPENVATEAARVALATASAGSDAATPTPLPYNAVIAEYVYATPVPGNEATAIADAVIATASAKVNGTPTPLRWNNIIITAVPSPTELPPPTATPLPLIQSITEFTPTPTPLGPQEVPDVLPDYLRNKILFKTNRNGPEEVYALDPLTGELYRINETWVYPLAQRRLGLSPGGDYQAIVKEASDGTKQIHIRSLAHDSTRQVTALNGIGNGRDVLSYDPDWSPRGDLIVFVSTNSGNDEIYTVTVDGSILQQLTTNGYEWDKHPSWSPDGQQIVFFSNRESGRRQLWVMNANGSGQQNLSNNAYEDWDPIWIR
ncbi:MAG: PD40 domain-containing protein, partial [Caldilineaceae bacterium]|nr:PD40 domain-containing protein [Caldilineaceae bacterium]